MRIKQWVVQKVLNGMWIFRASQKQIQQNILSNTDHVMNHTSSCKCPWKLHIQCFENSFIFSPFNHSNLYNIFSFIAGQKSFFSTSTKTMAVKPIADFVFYCGHTKALRKTTIYCILLLFKWCQNQSVLLWITLNRLLSANFNMPFQIARIMPWSDCCENGREQDILHLFNFRTGRSCVIYWSRH